MYLVYLLFASSTTMCMPWRQGPFLDCHHCVSSTKSRVRHTGGLGKHLLSERMHKWMCALITQSVRWTVLFFCWSMGLCKVTVTISILLDRNPGCRGLSPEPHSLQVVELGCSTKFVWFALTCLIQNKIYYFCSERMKEGFVFCSNAFCVKTCILAI